jgi:KUP system potassium uptake protein
MNNNLSSVGQGNPLLTLMLGTIGIVYGDIGTSLLYAMRECFSGSHAVPPSPENVLGVISLIFWSLMLVISVKYVTFGVHSQNMAYSDGLVSSRLEHRV